MSSGEQSGCHRRWQPDWPQRQGGFSGRLGGPARYTGKMHNPLDHEEARVLGCLLEKQLATPDYYPLTPAALVTACNQTSNRDPVVSWDDTTVEAAAGRLRQRGMAAMVHLAGSRVPKFKHLLEEYFPTLGEAEHALLCVMLLRGPQTAAELRARTERLHHFADTDAVERTLQKLITHGEGALVVHLPPGNGRRVAAYAHLLCGEAAAASPAPAAHATIIPPDPDRLAALESALAATQDQLAALTARLDALENALGN